MSIYEKGVNIIFVVGIHDQSKNDWQCWAYAIATMLRTSTTILLNRLINEQNQIKQRHLRKADTFSDRIATSNASLKIDSLTKQLEKLNSKNHHKKVRMELMMVVFPIRANTASDGVDPRIVIDRVYTYNTYILH